MPPTATPRLVLLIVVCSVASLAAIGMVSVAIVMYYKMTVDPVALQAIIQLTTTFAGVLTGMLINTRQPTEGAATTTMPVQVVNPPSEPVPTTETTKP